MENNKESLSTTWGSIKETLLEANAVQVTLICAIVYFSYLGFFFYFTDFIVCTVINFGDKFVDRSQLPGLCSLTVSPGGYDGQFFYRLALDPFLTSDQDFGVTLDDAPYRHQRILYPAIAHILSFGNPDRVPYVLVAINYCAICGITFYLAKLFQNFQAKQVYALAFATYPGLVVSLSRSLSEPLSIFFIVLCLYFLLNSRNILASAFLCLAVLTRETALVVAIVGGIVWLLQIYSERFKFNFPRISIWFWLVPLIGYLSWQGYIYHHWGVLGFEQGASKAGLPLVGIFNAVIEYQFDNWLGWLLSIQIMWIGGFFLYLLFFSESNSAFIRLLWLSYAILAFSLSHLVWSSQFGFLRVLSEFHLFGFLLLALSKARCKIIFVIGWFGLWLSTATIETSISYNIWLQNSLR